MSKGIIIILVIYFIMGKFITNSQLKAEMVFGYFDTLKAEMMPVYDYNNQTLSGTILSNVIKTYRQDAVPILQYSSDYKLTDANQLVSEDYYNFEDDEYTGETVEEVPKTVNKFDLSKWQNASYLRKHIYQVDSTTMITNGEINGKRLLSKDLSLKKTKSPQILIYHTHGSETYKDSRKGKKSDTVIGVGDQLEKNLKNKGISVIHDRSIYDYRNGKEERSKAYNYAASSIERYLKKYPSIKVVIDLHRDGVKESTKLVTTQNGKEMAQIMFFNGISRTAKNGDIKYLRNPNKEMNLSFSLQLQANAAKSYPGFTRKIYIKGYRYNLHFRARSLLVEVGAQNNTVKQAKRAMTPLAEILNNVLY